MKVKSEREVAQSCLTLSDPMDCSPPGPSIHGTFQARVLEWVAIAFSTRRAKDLKHPNPGKMFLWNTSPLSSWSAGLPNKVAILCSNNSFLNLLASHVVKR